MPVLLHLASAITTQLALGHPRSPLAMNAPSRRYVQNTVEVKRSALEGITQARARESLQAG